MDSFTIGVIVKALLASAGLKATLAIIVVAAFFAAIYKATKAVGAFLSNLIANRDAMLSQTMQRMAEQDARRAQYERETAVILATINTKVDTGIGMIEQTQKQMHDRFNAL